jgi:hypothetical protein
VLLNARRYDGAYYLAGYAVECALKACIARKTKKGSYPDKNFVNQCFTHNVDVLANLAGIRPALNAAHPDVALNWAIVKDWNEHARYGRKKRAEAVALYNAIAHPTHGILTWIKSHW